MNLSTAFSSIDLLKMSIKMRLMYWVLLYYCYLDLFWLFFLIMMFVLVVVIFIIV